MTSKKRLIFTYGILALLLGTKPLSLPESDEADPADGRIAR